MHDTAYAMALARNEGIRVPAIKRTIEHRRHSYYIMERIAGTTLDEAWPRLGLYTSFRLALSLRAAIQKLRSHVSPTAGSLVTGKCRSLWLDDRFKLPIRATPGDIHLFIRFWANFKGMRQAVSSEGVTVDSKVYMPAIPEALVFTHCDLAPRNLLVDAEGELWMLDWEDAGYYPPFFEYAGMHNFNPHAEGWGWFARLKWTVFTWIVAGRWENERLLLEGIRSKFTRFPAGRRFWLLRHGGPSARAVD